MKRAWLLPLTLLALWGIANADEPPMFRGMVDAHNAVRGPLGIAPLRWSPLAARQAQVWADQLAAEGCAARYNPDPLRRELYGENVLRAFSAQPYEGALRQPAEVVARWAAEGADYDHQAHHCRLSTGTRCGQYLAVIWGRTEVVGCGFARCPSAEVWVCNYTPRGGQAGERPFGDPVARVVATRPVASATPAPPQMCLGNPHFDFERALDRALQRPRL